MRGKLRYWRSVARGGRANWSSAVLDVPVGPSHPRGIGGQVTGVRDDGGAAQGTGTRGDVGVGPERDGEVDRESEGRAGQGTVKEAGLEKEVGIDHTALALEREEGGADPENEGGPRIEEVVVKVAVDLKKGVEADQEIGPSEVDQRRADCKIRSSRD